MKPTSPFGFWTRFFTTLVTLGGLAYGSVQLYLAYRFYKQIDSALSLGLFLDTGNNPLSTADVLGRLMTRTLLSGSAIVALTLILYFAHIYLLSLASALSASTKTD